MTIPRKSNWIADAALLTSACMWGINIPVVKFAIANLEPLVFNASRMIFSTIALGFLAWLEYRHRPQMHQPIQWGRVLAFTTLSGLLYSLFFMFGIQRTTAANAAMLMSSMPMWTAFLSMIFLKERLKGITWVGLLITIFGTSIVILSKGKIDFGANHQLGNLLILAGSLTWASATVMSHPLMSTIGPLRLAFLSSLISTPIHWLIVLCLYPIPWNTLFEVPVLTSILYSGLLSTGLAYATWNFGVQRLGGSHASVYQNIVTMVAVLGGWIVLREQLLLVQILGGIVMIAGLLIMRKGRS